MDKTTFATCVHISSIVSVWYLPPVSQYVVYTPQEISLDRTTTWCLPKSASDSCHER